MSNTRKRDREFGDQDSCNKKIKDQEDNLTPVAPHEHVGAVVTTLSKNNNNKEVPNKPQTKDIRENPANEVPITLAESTQASSSPPERTPLANYSSLFSPSNLFPPQPSASLYRSNAPQDISTTPYGLFESGLINEHSLENGVLSSDYDVKNIHSETYHVKCTPLCKKDIRLDTMDNEKSWVIISLGQNIRTKEWVVIKDYCLASTHSKATGRVESEIEIEGLLGELIATDRKAIGRRENVIIIKKFVPGIGYNHNYKFEEKINYAIQLAKQCAELHSKNILHCDITLSNIVIEKEKLHLIDHDVSLVMKDGFATTPENVVNGPLLGVAPEIQTKMFTGKSPEYNTQTDIFILGRTIATMFNLNDYLPTYQFSLMTFSMTANPPKKTCTENPTDLQTQKLIELTIKMTSQKPEERGDMQQIIGDLEAVCNPSNIYSTIRKQI